MSVRNILDGTIPVGGSGGLTPETDITVGDIDAKTIKALSVTTVGGGNFNQVNARSFITTPHSGRRRSPCISKG